MSHQCAGQVNIFRESGEISTEETRLEIAIGCPRSSPQVAQHQKPAGFCEVNHRMGSERPLKLTVCCAMHNCVSKKNSSEHNSETKPVCSEAYSQKPISNHLWPAEHNLGKVGKLICSQTNQILKFLLETIITDSSRLTSRWTIWLFMTVWVCSSAYGIDSCTSGVEISTLKGIYTGFITTDAVTKISSGKGLHLSARQ